MCSSKVMDSTNVVNENKKNICNIFNNHYSTVVQNLLFTATQITNSERTINARMQPTNTEEISNINMTT